MQAQNHPGRSIGKLIAFAALLISNFLPSHALANSYYIHDLGKDFIPISISDSGLILGKDISTSAITTKRIIYPNDAAAIDPTAIRIDPVDDLGNFEASQINDGGERGFVVGASNNTATLRQNGLESSEWKQPPFSTLSLITATAINGFNEIVGTRLEGGYHRPFHYDLFSGRLTTLGTLGGAAGWANDVNDSGYLVGRSLDKNGNHRAFRYTSKSETLAAINPLPGYKHSDGWRINDDESVVGWAYNDTRNQTGMGYVDKNGRVAYNDTRDQAGRRAFYNTLSGKMVNLGTLGKDTDSAAHGINNHGLIVGQSIRANGKLSRWDLQSLPTNEKLSPWDQQSWENSRAFLFDTSSADVMSVVADPLNANTVYAYSNKGSGMLKSTDRGATWQTINAGLADKAMTVNMLLIHPDTPYILYAGTNAGLYKSTNGGTSWARLPGKLEDVKVNALHFDLQDKKHLFAGTDGGILYSIDEGANWTLANNSTSFATYNFASHSKYPDTIFAATNRGVYSSVNRGVFWSRQNGQDNSKLLSQTVSALAIDPNDNETLYAGTVGGGVFTASITAGSLQWKQVNDNTLFNLNVYALLFYNNNGVSTLFAGTTGGLFKREIGSPIWEIVPGLGARGVYSLAAAPSGGNTPPSLLYVSSFDGDIFRSDLTPPLGSNWKSITRGVSESDVYALAVIGKNVGDPTSKTMILAGASNGCFSLTYKTPGDSTDWKSPRSGASGMKVVTISSDSRTTPYTLWAGSSDQGVLISRDSGSTWSFSNDGLDNWNIYALAVDTTPAIPTVFAATMGGVYRSDDGGEHWTSASNGLNNSPVYSLLIDTSVTPALLYAGTKKGIYRSSDYGRFWVPMNSGMENNEIVALLLSRDGTTLLAGSLSGGLFVSHNNGQSWSSANSGTIYPIFDLAEDPFAPGSILAATNNGLHKLSDCTTSSCIWGETSLEEISILAVRFDPDNANHIYAGTEGNGVQVSKNLGVSWQRQQGITTVTNRMEDLNDLLVEGQPVNWSLQDASDINNTGEIIGWGYQDSDNDGTYETPHGYLLTPSIGTSWVDLVVTQSIQPETVKQGIPFNYQIAITNRGPGTETNAKLIDWLPPDITFRYVSTSTSVLPKEGYCEKLPENIVRCELGGINPGETVYVNISMESPYRDIQIHNVARVKGNERDIDFSNNTTTSGNTVTIDKCFIATAAYGSFLDPHVTALRAFRDKYLLTNALGREFVTFYYRYSPPIADLISRSELLRGVTRLVLAPIVYAALYPLVALMLMITAISGVIYYRRRKKDCCL